jgi:hypothetical protein
VTVLLLVVAVAFTAALVADFRIAVFVYLALFQVVPITVAVDLGAALPLITLPRLLLLPLLVTFAARVVLGRTRLDGIALWGPLSAYGIALVASTVLSEAPNGAATLRCVSYFTEEWALFLVAASVVRTREDGELVLTLLLAGVVASLVFAAYELASDANPLLEMATRLSGRDNLVYDYSLERRFGLRRIQSLFRNPLDYGVYLSLLLPIAAAFRLWAHARWQRAVASAALAGGIVAVALTMSRTAIYSLMVSGLVYVSFRRQWRVLFRSLVAAVVLGVAVVVVFDFPLRDYLYRSAVAPEQLQGDLGGSSLSNFFLVSGNHLSMSLEHPIFGRGIATLPPSAAGRILDSTKLGFGEQGLTYLLVEAGAIGLGAFLWLLAAMGFSLRDTWRAARSALGRDLGLAVLCSLAGWMVSIELAGIWHFSLLLVLVAVALRMRDVPEDATVTPGAAA